MFAIHKGTKSAEQNIKNIIWKEVIKFFMPHMYHPKKVHIMATASITICIYVISLSSSYTQREMTVNTKILYVTVISPSKSYVLRHRHFTVKVLRHRHFTVKVLSHRHFNKSLISRLRAIINILNDILSRAMFYNKSLQL